MKLFSSKLALIGIALTATIPLFADKLSDAMEETKNVIVRKFPDEDSFARKEALQQLESIVSGDLSEARKNESFEYLTGQAEHQLLMLSFYRAMAEYYNDAFSQWYLGLCYELGNGVKRSPAEAVNGIEKLRNKDMPGDKLLSVSTIIMAMASSRTTPRP